MIDSHAHILKRYYEEDFDSVLAESISNLDMIINISFSINSSKEVVELAKTNDKLKAVIGVHPNDVNKLSGDYISEIENLIDENVVAIGEVGLDYHYEGYDKELQKKIFIEFIELARKHNLPVVVHSREANEDTINIIKEYSDVKFLFHS
jgi:TatD DNase family protein